MKRALLGVLWLAACAAATRASGAELMISAQADKTVVALNDQIVLEVSVAGSHASLPDPQMPPLANFSVYSSGKNQSISFINGNISSTVIYTYVLVPHFVGKGVIPPISLTYEGKTAKTDPIEIQVQPPSGGASAPPPAKNPRRPAQASAPANRAPDIFVAAEVDKKQAYVNEQVNLTVKFYTSVTLLGNPQYNAPKISGFISEDLPPERHGNVALHGRNYYFSEVKTALFPAQAGKLAIGAATVRCQIQQNIAIDPFASDFFQKFFAQGAVTAQNRDFSSDPLLLTAEPLPEAGKPANFSGAVGAYSITAAVDRSAAKVGDALNLTVTVSGTGNLKAVGDPKLPDLPSFRVYDSVSSMNLDKKNDLVTGSKVFKTVIVPRVSGSLTIPSITFSYFDPSKKSYMRASTLPISLNIAPGEGGTASAAASGPAAGPAPQGLTSVNEDIRYLKPKHGGSPFSKLLEAAAEAGPIHSVPFLVFAGALVFAQYKERGASDKKGSRFKNASRAAASRIRQAGQLPSDDPRKVALLSDALTNYIADKLDLTASGLTLRRAQELLRLRQPSFGEAQMQNLKDIWDELDLLRFAPSQARQGDLERLQALLSQLIKEFDHEIKKK